MNRSAAGPGYPATVTTPSRPPSSTVTVTPPPPPPTNCCPSTVTSVSPSVPPTVDLGPSAGAPPPASCWQTQTLGQDFRRRPNNHVRNQHLSPPNHQQQQQQQRLHHPPPPNRPLLPATQRRRNDDGNAPAASSSMRSVGGSVFMSSTAKIDMTRGSSSTSTAASVNCFRCRGRRDGSSCCSNETDKMAVAGNVAEPEDDEADANDAIDIFEWTTLDELRQIDIHGLRQLLLRQFAVIM
jgi:hypothetical protein